MIPLSSRIDKYKKIVENKEKAGKPCDIIHIVKLDDSRESAFLIQDMFPITEKYIEREYTIAGNHLMVTSEHVARTIEQKAKKVLKMLKRGVKFTPTQPDVLTILEKLKTNYISLFSYLFISYQMSAKPYFIGSTGIYTFCSRSHIGAYLLMFSLSNVVNFVVNTSMLSDALSLFWHSQ